MSLFSKSTTHLSAGVNLNEKGSAKWLRCIFQFDLSPISLGQDSYVLEDLVAQPPDVEVVADVLHQLEDQLRLVQGLEAGVNLY